MIETKSHRPTLVGCMSKTPIIVVLLSSWELEFWCSPSIVTIPCGNDFIRSVLCYPCALILSLLFSFLFLFIIFSYVSDVYIMGISLVHTISVYLVRSFCLFPFPCCIIHTVCCTGFLLTSGVKAKAAPPKWVCIKGRNRQKVNTVEWRAFNRFEYTNIDGVCVCVYVRVYNRYDVGVLWCCRCTFLMFTNAYNKVHTRFKLCEAGTSFYYLLAQSNL